MFWRNELWGNGCLVQVKVLDKRNGFRRTVELAKPLAPNSPLASSGTTGGAFLLVFLLGEFQTLTLVDWRMGPFGAIF